MKRLFKELLVAWIAVFVFVALFNLGGCETTQAIKSQVKPKTNEQALVYAYGQVYVAKEALAYIYANPKMLETKTGKAAAVLIADKVGRIFQDQLSNTMEQLQAGAITQAEALQQVNKQSDAYSKINTDNPRFLMMQAILSEVERSLDAISLAMNTVGVVKECVIRIENMPPLPCSSKSDYLLLLLLQAHQVESS